MGVYRLMHLLVEGNTKDNLTLNSITDTSPSIKAVSVRYKQQPLARFKTIVAFRTNRLKRLSSTTLNPGSIPLEFPKV